jgi:hypothetical protein
MSQLHQAGVERPAQSQGMDQPDIPPEEAPQQLSRPQAIERMRAMLKRLTDEDQCLCAVVGRLGIFCKGFKQYSDAELKQRFDWIARKRPHATREQLEELANLYYIGRGEATGAAIACDFETREHAGCDGWNNFTNQELEGFYRTLVGQPVRIGG